MNINNLFQFSRQQDQTELLREFLENFTETETGELDLSKEQPDEGGIRQKNLKTRIQELIALAEKNRELLDSLKLTPDQDTLDNAVLDEMTGRSTMINNQGPESQIAFLLIQSSWPAESLQKMKAEEE